MSSPAPSSPGPPMPRSSSTRAMSSPPTSVSARSRRSRSPAPAPSACASSSDNAPPALLPPIFLPESLDRLVSGAVTLARITSEDPFAGLPEPSEFGQHSAAAQQLYFDDVNQQPPADRIHIARGVEAAAFAFDTRIQNSGGGDFDTATSHKIYINSRGFLGEYRRSYCGFSAQPIAHEPDGRMQRDYWYSAARSTRLLEDSVAIGQEAARRTLQRLGARRPGPSEPPSSSPRRSPAPSSATSSTPQTATPSIAMPASSPVYWASASQEKTSPSSTTERWSPIANQITMAQSRPVASVPRPSMAKACPPAAPSSSRTASSGAT